MALSAEQIRKKVKNGSYKYEDTNGSDSLSASAIRNQVKKGSYNYSNYEPIDIDSYRAKNKRQNSMAVLKADREREERERKSREAALRYKNEATNIPADYESAKNYYKNKKKDTWNNQVKEWNERNLTHLNYKSSDNDKLQADKEYDTAKAEHKEVSKQYDTLRKNKWDETQSENLRIIQDDNEIGTAVEEARNAKTIADNMKKQVNALAMQSNANPQDYAVKQEYDRQNAEYQKYMNTYLNNKTFIENKGYDADSLIDTYDRRSNLEESKVLEQDTKQFTEEHPVLANIASPIINSAQTAALPNIVEAGIKSAITGDYIPLDYNDSNFGATNVREGITGTTSDMIADRYDSEFGKAASQFLYQTGMSIADFASLAAMPQPVSLAIMGSGAAVSSAKDATQRGANGSQAMASAIASGLAEVVFEKLSLENLAALKVSGATTAKEFVKDILKQSFTEGSEEVFTEISNIITDQIINGDNASFMREYNDLVNAYGGGEEAQSFAKKQVALDMAKQVGLAGLGGALSGMAIGGGVSAINAIGTNIKLSDQGDLIKATGGTEELTNEGLRHSQSKAYDLASDVIGDDKVSSRKLGRLQVETQKALDLEDFEKIATNYGDSNISNTFKRITEGKSISKNTANDFMANEEARMRLEAVTGIEYNPNQSYKQYLNDVSRNYGRISIDNAYNNRVVEHLGEDYLSRKENDRKSSYNIKATLNDKPADIVDVEKQDGQVMVELADGSKVDAKSVDFENESEAQLFESASFIPKGITNAYISGYDDNTSVTDYNDGVIAVYEAQKQGLSLNEAVAKAQSVSKITLAQAKLIYEATENNTRSIMKTESYKKAVNSPIKAGTTVIANNLTPMQKVETEFLNEFGKKIGREFIIVNNTSEIGYDDANGFYHNGKIVLSLDNQGGMMSVYAGHELFHDLKQTAKEDAQELEDFVIEKLKADKSYNYSKRLEEVIELNGFKGTRESQVAMAHEEMAANACFTVLSNEKQVNELAEQNKTLAQKIRDFFKRFIARIKEALETVAQKNAEYRALKDDLETVDKIYQLFKKALQNSNIEAQSNDTRYSVKEDDNLGYHAGDLGKAEYLFKQSGTRSTGHFGTGTYFVGNEEKIKTGRYKERPHHAVDFNRYNLYRPKDSDQGFDLHDFLWNVDRLYLDDVKSPVKTYEDRDKYEQMLDEALDDYYYLGDNATQKDIDKIESLIVDIYGESEAQEYLENKDYYKALEDISSNKQLSDRVRIFSSLDYFIEPLFGKDIDVFDILEDIYTEADRAVSQGEDLYHDSKATMFMKSLGYDGVDVRGIDKLDNTEYGSVIYDINADDIRFSKKEDADGNKLTDAQVEYFKDSKVRDEQGRLIPVYHGTEAEFNTFSLANRGINGELLGIGYYFTDAKEEAQRFSKGKRIIDSYLNIKKPITSDKLSITKEEWGKFLDFALANRDEYISNVWKGNDINKDYELRAFNDNGNDIELIQMFINSTAGGNNAIAESYLKMLTDSIGYDGVIAINDNFNVYVAFNPNQIKSINNENPTKDDDIRFSKKEDSNGNELSEQQIEYFKNSKIRDSEGRLKIVYHGSRSNFNIFSKAKGGQSTSIANVGFWFTTTKQGAKNFADLSWWGDNKDSTVYESYINIKNPKIYSLLDNSKEVEKLQEEKRKIDYEMNLYDTIYSFEDGNKYHNHYYEYDKSKRRNSNINEWEAFEAIVKKYAEEDIEYYLSQVAEPERTIVKKDSKRYIELAEKYKENSKELNILRYNDPYEQFKTDIYALAGQSVEDANIGGLGKELIGGSETVNKYVENLKKEGYDGIIIEDTDYDSDVFDGKNTQYVVFDSNQAKLTSNKAPTTDDDIRFSLKEPVESTDELIAVHNIEPDNLLRALKLGGFPMPSIAIMKATHSYTNYGDISIIFDKTTIDPRLDKKNMVFSGDAWTPTFPVVEYEPNENVLKKVDKYLRSKVSDELVSSLGGANLDYNNIEYELNSSRGDLHKTFRNNYPLKYLYLVDKGIKIETPFKEKEFSDRFENDIVKSVADSFTADELYNHSLKNSNRNFDDNFIERVKNVANQSILERYKTVEDVYNIFKNKPYYNDKNFGFAQASNLIEAAIDYQKETGEAKEIDYIKLRDEINNKIVDESDFANWLNKLFDGIVERSGIRNNKDLFTPSGNRRSFKALHFDVTLDNIVRAMKMQGEQGIGGFGNKSITGAAKVKYKSIGEIKENADRIKLLSNEELTALKNEQIDRLKEITFSLAKYSDSMFENFEQLDATSNLLVEAVMHNRTKSGMANYIKREGKGWTNYSDYVVDDLYELVQDIRNMPTAYFEAKPQRAVMFDEVRAVVMPDVQDEEYIEIKQLLDDMGIQVIKYKDNDEQSRIEALNSVDDVRFSRKENPTYEDLLEENEELEDINNNLRADISKLRNEFKITGRHNLSDNSIGKVATELRKEYASDYSHKVLKEQLANLYDYIANAGYDIDNGFIWQKAKDIATNILNESYYQDTTLYDEFAEAREYLKNTRIWASEYFTSDMVDYNKFRKHNFGRLKLVNDPNAVGVDEAYQFLNSLFPSYFYEDAGVGEKLEIMGQFFDDIKPVYRSNTPEIARAFEISENEVTNLIASQIFEHYFDVIETKTFAEKKQKELIETKTKYKNKIADLKQSYQEQYQERLAVEKAKIKDEKDKKALAVAKVKAHAKQVQANASIRRAKSNVKAKIRRVKKDLDKRLLNPTDNVYVPMDLVKEVARVCDILTSADEYKTENAKRSDNVLLQLDVLHTKYEALKNDKDYDYQSEYDPDFANAINTLAEQLRDKQIAQLSLSELEDVYQVVKSIKDSLVDATHQIGKDEKISNHEIGVKIIREMQKTKGIRSSIIGKYELSTLTPMRAIARMTEYEDDAELKKLFDDLNKGQRKANKFKLDASRPFDELDKNAKELKRFAEAPIKTAIKATDGKSLVLTERDIVTLLLTAQRPSAENHLVFGGFVIPDVKLLEKGNYNDAITKGQKVKDISIFEILDLKKHLSEYGKKWLKEAKTLFNEVSSRAINDTSIQLKHRKLANEINYIPMIVDKTQVGREIEAVKFDSTIEGMGSLKSVTPNATQRLVILGIDQLVDRHIDDVAKYYGLAIPIRNFNKAYNIRTSSFYDTDLDDTTVKEAISQKWGQSGIGMIEDVLADLQSPRKVRGMQDNLDDIWNKITNGAISTALLANPSVALKQLASYATTLGYFEDGNLTKAAINYVSLLNKHKFDALMDKIDRYTATLYMRRIGMTTNEIGKLTKDNALLTKIPAYANPMKWMTYVDVKTAAVIWVACENQIKKDNPNLNPNSDEFGFKVAELYDEVIENTQAVYDVLNRAGVMKKKDPLHLGLTLFKTQSFHNIGMMYHTFNQMKAKAKKYKANSTAENKKAYVKARKSFARTMIGQLIGATTFVGLGVFISALKHGMYQYRDEDKRVTLESVLKGFFVELFSYIVENVAVLTGDIVTDVTLNAYEGVTGDGLNRYNDDPISILPISAINDVVEGINKLNTTVGGLINDEKSIEDVGESLRESAIQISTALGLPIKTPIGYVKGFMQHIEDAKNGEFGSFEAGVTRNTKQKLHLITEEIGIGEHKYYDKYADELYSKPGGSDLLFVYLEKYGYNSAEYKREEKKYVEAKKKAGTEKPNPLGSMKSKAVKKCVEAQTDTKNYTAKDYQNYRKIVVQLYGSESKANEAIYNYKKKQK